MLRILSLPLVPSGALPAGAVAALAVLLRANGGIDRVSYRRLTDWLDEPGADCIVIVGSTGEDAKVRRGSASEAIELTAAKSASFAALSIVDCYDKPMQSFYQRRQALSLGWRETVLQADCRRPSQVLDRMRDGN